MPLRFVALIAVLALAGCDASRTVAPGAPPESTLPVEFSVRYDSTLTTPATIVNTNLAGSWTPGAPAPFPDDEAFRIARQFIVNHAPAFQYRVGLDDFVVRTSLRGNGQNIVKMQQTYRGLPVDVMGYASTVVAGGEIAFMNGHFMPNILVSTLPLFHVSKVEPLAIAALEPTPTHATEKPGLLVTTYDGIPRLTWGQTVANDLAAWQTWTVMVDATDGHVLGVQQNFIIN